MGTARSVVPRGADATAMDFSSSSSLMAYCATSLFSWLPSGAPSARRWPFGPSADVCARASSKVVKFGIMRSMPVIARTRRTGAAAIASSTSPPSAWARLCAASSVCSPDESQNWVRVMSTTRVPCPCAAASSRADRSSGALVMSISSRAVTTGTPLTTSKGEPAVMHLGHRLGPRTLLLNAAAAGRPAVPIAARGRDGVG